MTSFFAFMASAAGRITRIAAGVVLIVLGGAARRRVVGTRGGRTGSVGRRDSRCVRVRAAVPPAIQRCPAPRRHGWLSGRLIHDLID